MKKRNIAGKLATGILAFAMAAGMAHVMPKEVQAASKPGTTKVQSAEGYVSDDGDAAGIAFTWKKVSGAKGYQYRYNLFWTKGSKDYEKGLTTKTSAKISFQDHGSIVFQVRAYTTNAKGKKMYGKWTTKKLSENKVDTMIASVTEEETESVFEKDEKLYASVISGLKKGQYYTFADINAEFDALLVTDYVYDNLDGNQASIQADVYGLDQQGNVEKKGSVECGGTAYPLAVADGCLFCGHGHLMEKVSVEASSAALVIKEQAEEVFDTSGKATYYYTGADGKKNTKTDDSDLTRLFSEYEKATVLNFFTVK